jgi:hypothetical protein
MRSYADSLRALRLSVSRTQTGGHGRAGPVNGSGHLELDPGDPFGQRYEPGTGVVVHGVLIVGGVGLGVGEVGDDRETPVALGQPEVVSDHIAEHAGAVQVKECFWAWRPLWGPVPL